LAVAALLRQRCPQALRSISFAFSTRRDSTTAFAPVAGHPFEHAGGASCAFVSIAQRKDEYGARTYAMQLNELEIMHVSRSATMMQRQ